MMKSADPLDSTCDLCIRRLQPPLMRVLADYSAYLPHHRSINRESRCARHLSRHDRCRIRSSSDYLYPQEGFHAYWMDVLVHPRVRPVPFSSLDVADGISFPVYSLFLPIYSFWSMDDFSWGSTRKVIGEGNNKTIVYEDDMVYDDSMIPMKSFKGKLMCSQSSYSS